MAEFKIPFIEQIESDDALSIFKNGKSEITDLSILLGGYCDDKYISNWLIDSGLNQMLSYTDKVMGKDYPTLFYGLFDRRMSQRPTINFDGLKEQFPEGKTIRDYGDYFVFVAGEYPQTAVDMNLNNLLSHSNEVKKTGKTYVFDCNDCMEVQKFKQYKVNEYKYKDSKYIMLDKDKIQNILYTILKTHTVTLHNTMQFDDYDDKIWIKVEPVVWLVDKKSNVAVTQKALFSNIQYEETSEHYSMKDNIQVNLIRYLNEHFAKEIIPSGDRKLSLSSAIDSIRDVARVEKPIVIKYALDYTTFSKDELLQVYVKAGNSVFLHGPSGVGKSARVKQIDPTATRITLRPQMNPEEIDGTLNRETGEYIPPLWYTQLCEKCKAEPDRKHILFIDELTNVKPTVQSLVYSIVLDRAGKDGLWPLPDNAVVVGAGNENADNLAAYPMTNALYRRFCHIYFEVNVNTWIEWATGIKRYNEINTIENDSNDQFLIHPYLLAFVISRGINILYQDLDEENPQIVTDPRKWEIASRVFYATNNPNALFPALGNSITNEFINFTKDVLLSVDDVVNDKIKDVDYKGMDETYKKSIIAGLTIAKVEDLNEVRKFIADNFEDNYLTMFDAMWTHNEPDRMKIIQSLQNNKTTKKSLSKTILSKKEETNISQNDLQKNEEILTPQIEDKPIEDKPKNKKRLREFFR